MIVARNTRIMARPQGKLEADAALPALFAAVVAAFENILPTDLVALPNTLLTDFPAFTALFRIEFNAATAGDLTLADIDGKYVLNSLGEDAAFI